MILDKNPNPTKDQHFMVDENMLQHIYDVAGIESGESILEIGGGSGALTDYLVQGDNYITVIEKDPYYAEFLKEKYKGYSNVNVVFGDALEFEYSGYDRIVANLPYTITEPFLVNLAITGVLDYNPHNPNGSNVKSVTLVLSQNSTRKMVAPIQVTEGSSRHINQEFGLMGAICKTFCDVNIDCVIPSEAFFPEPAVTSMLVNLTPKKEKTTVDRIMKEFLIDKKNNRPSIQRVYNLMLSQEKIYKTKKHKNNNNSNINPKFTSANILNKNIYELTNAQLSQLVQDLIRNDIAIKSKNSQNRKNKSLRSFDDIDRYFVDGKFVYNKDEYIEDEYEFDLETKPIKSKFEKKYEYMYDSVRYNLLLHRGLEYLDPKIIEYYLNGEINEEKLSEELNILARRR